LYWYWYLKVTYWYWYWYLKVKYWYLYWYLDHWYWYWYWYLFVEYLIQDCQLDSNHTANNLRKIMGLKDSFDITQCFH